VWKTCFYPKSWKRKHMQLQVCKRERMQLQEDKCQPGRMWLKDEGSAELGVCPPLWRSLSELCDLCVWALHIVHSYENQKCETYLIDHYIPVNFVWSLHFTSILVLSIISLSHILKPVICGMICVFCGTRHLDNHLRMQCFRVWSLPFTGLFPFFVVVVILVSIECWCCCSFPHPVGIESKSVLKKWVVRPMVEEAGC
jgi:hypothetical protein